MEPRSEGSSRCRSEERRQRAAGLEASLTGSFLTADGSAPEPDPGEKKNPEKPPKPIGVAAVSQENVTPEAAAEKTSHRRASSVKSQNATGSQTKRRSWRRSSLKGTKRRKSLPPFHQDVTELSQAISLDLPETDRLSMLLLSSFQFSAQKLEHILEQTEGFSPEAFKTNVSSVSEDLKRYIEKLKLDGTLRSCVEKAEGASSDAVSDESVGKAKEYIARFSAECQAWDELLQRYQKDAEEMSRQLEECRSKQGRAEPPNYLQTSQAEVLSTKPNYQRILDEQGEVLSCMELVLDELQQAVKLLQAFGEDSSQYLRGLSERLAARTFRQLENSPVRKLIAAPGRKAPPEG
ncbi:kinetochore-associated protein DSN1 homolog [Numida meleagris]|uniref:kinetochore-associated protein DSN1 homolog n=1 Tax=Numida meleagris TaxID=8996 RepID=UPI000B3D84D5|nr:kinetochore-associated protein DSN1 homolog [Numida meleagris]